jgi:hypothetical protein
MKIRAYGGKTYFGAILENESSMRTYGGIKVSRSHDDVVHDTVYLHHQTLDGRLLLRRRRQILPIMNNIPYYSLFIYIYNKSTKHTFWRFTFMITPTIELYKIYSY